MSKILIVDDNPIDHMITSYVLRNCYQLGDLIVMERATDALAYLDSNLGNVEELPSLIILDLDMPGLNGIGFLEKFSQYNQELKNICKIVVLTGSDVVADLLLLETHPHVLQLISKPLSKTSLSNVISVA